MYLKINLLLLLKIKMYEIIDLYVFKNKFLNT